jgi:hypothetical protein
MFIIFDLKNNLFLIKEILIKNIPVICIYNELNIHRLPHIYKILGSKNSLTSFYFYLIFFFKYIYLYERVLNKKKLNK